MSDDGMWVDPFWMRPYVPHELPNVKKQSMPRPPRPRKPRPKKPSNPVTEPDTLEKVDHDMWHYWRIWYAEQREKAQHKPPDEADTAD